MRRQVDIVIDIETIPDQSPGALDKIKSELTVKAPDLTKPKLIDALGLGDQGKYKTVPELKDMWLDRFGDEAKGDQANEKWLKTSLDGAYGSIVCVCFNDKVFASHGGTEAELLNDMWRAIDYDCNGVMPRFIAHNAKFDLPFLFHRSVILGVKPAKGFKPYGRHGSDYYCTMEAWAGYNGMIGLDRLAKILGLKGKTEGMSGSEVWPEYQKGNIDRIVEYCQDDVKLTKLIYEKLTFKQVK